MDFDSDTESISEHGALQGGGGDDGFTDSDDEFNYTPPDAAVAAPPAAAAPAPVPAPALGNVGHLPTPHEADGRVPHPRPPWCSAVLPETTWPRQVEYDSIPPALIFAAPLSADAVDMFPFDDIRAGGTAPRDAIVLFKTPENLLGRMMIKHVAPMRVRVTWLVENTVFPSARLRPYAEADMEVDLIHHATEGDRLASFVDLSLGGFAWDSRTYRQMNKQRTGESEGHLLAPDVGFFFRRRADGTPVPFLEPCRGTLITYHVPHPKLLALHAAGVDAATSYLGNAEPNPSLVRMYKGLFRELPNTTHFVPHQVDALWQLYVSCCENGADDVEAKLDVLMQLQDLPAFLAKLLPAGDFIPAEVLEEEEDDIDEYKATIAQFLQSDAFVEGVWWLLSDPIASGYASMSPDSKRLNRVIHFSRVLEVLQVALFGMKDAIVELIVQLVVQNRPTVTRQEFADFFASTFPGEDAEGLVGLFDAQFEKDRLCVPAFRYSLLAMDVFGTWSKLILPLMQAKEWSRCNQDL